MEIDYAELMIEPKPYSSPRYLHFHALPLVRIFLLLLIPVLRLRVFLGKTGALLTTGKIAFIPVDDGQKLNANNQVERVF